MSLPSTSTRLWQRWKSIKLPWRRRWLAGTDLAGNSYFYFKPTAAPPRRILQHNPRIPYSDIVITPSWHQWLRHTRPTPPSLQEQQQDVVRQQQLKQLAAAADARWAAKPSVMDAPRRGNQELGVGDGEGFVGNVGRRGEAGRSLGKGEIGDMVKREEKATGEGIAEGTEEPGTTNLIADGQEVGRQRRERKVKENPWKQERGAAGEEYQPEAWMPGAGRR